MKHISRRVFFLIFISLSFPSLAQDCSEFGNNHFMKWIDFDASCIGIEDLVSRIEGEGKWELMNPEGIKDHVLNYQSKSDSDMSLEVMFLGFGNKGAANIEITMKRKCNSILQSLEKIGFPKFESKFYELSDKQYFNVAINVGNEGLFILPHEQDGYCSHMTVISG